MSIRQQTFERSLNKLHTEMSQMHSDLIGAVLCIEKSNGIIVEAQNMLNDSIARVNNISKQLKSCISQINTIQMCHLPFYSSVEQDLEPPLESPARETSLVYGKKAEDLHPKKRKWKQGESSATFQKPQKIEEIMKEETKKSCYQQTEEETLRQTSSSKRPKLEPNEAIGKPEIIQENVQIEDSFMEQYREAYEETFFTNSNLCVVNWAGRYPKITPKPNCPENYMSKFLYFGFVDTVPDLERLKVIDPFLPGSLSGIKGIRGKHFRVLSIPPTSEKSIKFIFVLKIAEKLSGNGEQKTQHVFNKKFVNIRHSIARVAVVLALCRHYEEGYQVVLKGENYQVLNEGRKGHKSEKICQLIDSLHEQGIQDEDYFKMMKNKKTPYGPTHLPFVEKSKEDKLS